MTRGRNCWRCPDYRSPFSSVLADFDDDGQIRDERLTTLSDTRRQRVESVQLTYDATLAGTAIGGTATTGIGGCGLLGAYFFLVPVLIVGFVLTLTKKVWRCGTCAYVFDRG